MRKLNKATSAALVAIAVLGLGGVAFADVYVGGHYRSNGSYVKPHYRTNPDGFRQNNYSYPGNYNPNTLRITPRSSYGSRNYLNSFGNNQGRYRWR